MPTRKALWDKAQAAAKAANDSCGTAPETAAAGTLLTHAVRLSALAGKFDEAYAGLEAYPFKNSAAYSQNAVLPLGQYLLGQGMVEEARRFRDRLLTDDLWAAPRARIKALPTRWPSSPCGRPRIARNGKRRSASCRAKTGLAAHQFPAGERLRAMAQERSLVHAR